MVSQIGSVTSGAAYTASGSNKGAGDSHKKPVTDTGEAFTLELRGDIYDLAPADIVRGQKETAADTLRDVVQRLILRQQHSVAAVKINIEITGSDDAGGQIQADAASAISEDGEWGVNAVSDRIISFAKALAGDDISKIETLRGAIDKGFAGAKKTLGGALPDICGRTYDAVMRKLDDWAADADPAGDS